MTYRTHIQSESIFELTKPRHNIWRFFNFLPYATIVYILMAYIFKFSWVHHSFYLLIINISLDLSAIYFKNKQWITSRKFALSKYNLNFNANYQDESFRTILIDEANYFIEKYPEISIRKLK